MVKIVDDTLGFLNNLRKTPRQTFNDATLPQKLGIVGVPAAIGGLGIGALTGYDDQLVAPPMYAAPQPMPVSSAGQQMQPQQSRPVAQQNAGTGISSPQPQPTYNLQALMQNVQPINAEDASRLSDYTNRNINRDLILLAQLEALQAQLEGQA